MDARNLHPWPKSEEEAVAIQNEMRGLITVGEPLDGVQLIAGVDTAFDHIANVLYAAVVLFHYPHLEEQEKVADFADACFPYIPGLHAFREGPVILKAFRRLTTKPDLIIFAGHGIAHPRFCGMAGHLGLLLETPSIGCARRRLAGQYQEPAAHKGSSSPLYVENREVGRVYRSRNNVKPIYISPGYRCSLADAVHFVTGCLQGYRVPEPLRAAHRLANRTRRGRRALPQEGGDDDDE
jgi:deoxyribonuclease V